jgi:hypothetical protein
MTKAKSTNHKLTAEEGQALVQVLKIRFEKNMARHRDITWAQVEARLTSNEGGLWSLRQMEETGGEPDVVGREKKTGEYIFYDCSAESPAARRSLCYDREALDSRKEAKPRDSAMDMAKFMGVEILDEDQYRHLQELGEFDTKTSSWIRTPPAIRKLGGALFCDRRYDHVFVYHNGASSYYAARGFRALIKI